MVVALDLQRHGQPFAHVHHPGVLAWALEHAVARRGKGPQQRLAVLVGAVLAPHEAGDITSSGTCCGSNANH